MKLGTDVPRFLPKENIERHTPGIHVTADVCTFSQKIIFQKVYKLYINRLEI